MWGSSPLANPLLPRPVLVAGLFYCLWVSRFEVSARPYGRCTVSSHIRLSDLCTLARQSERRDIFANGEYLATPANKKGTFVYQKFLFCLSIAKAMVYHHALACISSALTSISRQSEYLINRRLYRFRNGDIQCSALMIYRNKLRMIYKAHALIYL